MELEAFVAITILVCGPRLLISMIWKLYLLQRRQRSEGGYQWCNFISSWLSHYHLSYHGNHVSVTWFCKMFPCCFMMELKEYLSHTQHIIYWNITGLLVLLLKSLSTTVASWLHSFLASFFHRRIICLCCVYTHYFLFFVTY